MQPEVAQIRKAQRLLAFATGALSDPSTSLDKATSHRATSLDRAASIDTVDVDAADASPSVQFLALLFKLGRQDGLLRDPDAKRVCARLPAWIRTRALSTIC